MTRVAILGAGRRGAQISCEWALGGCSVVWIDRDRETAEGQIEDTLRLFARHGLAGPAELERARALLEPREGAAGSEGRLTFVQEALPDDLELKAALLGELARHHPETLLACTGSTISPTELGTAAGAAERMLCTHYADPPALIATVELRSPPRSSLSCHRARRPTGSSNRSCRGLRRLRTAPSAGLPVWLPPCAPIGRPRLTARGSGGRPSLDCKAPSRMRL